MGATDKETKNKVYKKYRTILGTFFSLWIGKDPDPYQTAGSGSVRYRIEKQDPDPDPSQKQGPDPYQKGLDPQHCGILQKYSKNLGDTPFEGKAGKSPKTSVFIGKSVKQDIIKRRFARNARMFDIFR